MSARIPNAFSLVELLISLIIISVITTCFAPVMTRKLKYDARIRTASGEKRGIEIFSNPGTYAFNVPKNIRKLYISGSAGGGGGAGAVKKVNTIALYNGQEWTIPQGVTKVKVTITGAGGGGGAGYAVGLNDSQMPSCRPDFETTIVRGADSGAELCFGSFNLDNGYTNAFYNKEPHMDEGNAWFGQIVRVGFDGSTNRSAGGCPGGVCCFDPSPGNCSGGGCGRAVCTQEAAWRLCNSYKGSFGSMSSTSIGTYRLPTANELQYLVNKFDFFYLAFSPCHDGSNAAYGSSGLPFCGGWACNDVQFGWCFPRNIVAAEFNKNMVFSPIFVGSTQATVKVETLGLQTAMASSVRCVREVVRVSSRLYGGGGASGAVYEKTFKVVPGGILKATLGAMGQRGDFKANNGSGGQGGETALLYKSPAGTSAMMKVRGGQGGKSGNLGGQGGGGSINPCFDSTVSLNWIGCKQPSMPGENASYEKGGNGAVVPESGATPAPGGHYYVDPARGGYDRFTDLEYRHALGINGIDNVNNFHRGTAGSGGGGGYVPIWAWNTEVNNFPGGYGTVGSIIVTYEQVLPGGGGGGGASAGRNSANADQEIEYSVTPEDTIYITVGSGGGGGSAGVNGQDGNETTIQGNHIVFKPGKGGIIGNINSGTCGAGGAGGSLVMNSSKAKILNAGGSNKGAGYAGVSGCYTGASNGYEGGLGGWTFRGNFGSGTSGCGGGVLNNADGNFSCATPGSANGFNANLYNALQNKFGGGGGGGGGTVADGHSGSVVLGSGGSGADGYVRIRWGN